MKFVLMFFLLCFVTTVASITAQTSGKKSTQLDTETILANKEWLEKLFRAIAECKETGKCNTKLGVEKLTDWIQFSKYRNQERLGFEELDSSDFESLQKKFGNSIAKKFFIPNTLGSAFVWTLNESDDGAKNLGLISSKEAVTYYNPITGETYPMTMRVPTKISVKNLANILLKLMTGGESGVGMEKFVSFMLEKQSKQ